MILDLDVGNTRIKWRLLGGSGGDRSGAIGTGLDLSALVPDVERVDRIRVANVAGGAVQAAIDSWAAKRWQLVPEYARVAAQSGGVLCGYQNPAQLGVDRWLALLAAWQECHHACLIVDAGSAITLDFVTNRGQHLGGYIVPGLNMMQQSLFAGTSGARVRAVTVDTSCMHLSPGQDTDAAVRNGCLAMAAGFIHNSLVSFESDAVLFVTGGDADLLAPYTETDTLARIRPGLVLDGLALVLG